MMWGPHVCVCVSTVLVLVVVRCTDCSSAVQLLDKYGPFSIVLHSHLLKCNRSRTLGLDVSGMRVYLYDFLNDVTFMYTLEEAATSILRQQRHLLMPEQDSRPLVVFVPGFHTDVQGKSCVEMRDAFRQLGDTNLIIVDHSQYTSGGGYLAAYERSVRYLHDLAAGLSRLLTSLAAGGVQLNCIGHSLGAQLLGMAAAMARGNGVVLPRVTALDPAGPCFADAPIQYQVRSGVALYVEAYHCNAGELGSTRTLADADLFANGGRLQPGCARAAERDPASLLSARAARCSHEACVRQYAASVKRRGAGFVASRCRAPDADPSECWAPDSTSLAGYWSPDSALGVYYYTTHRRADDDYLDYST